MTRRKSPARSPSTVAAERIRTTRDRRGLTQAQLAAALTRLGHPMHQSAIAKIEARERKITLDDVLVLAVALDVPPGLLFVPVESDADLALTPTMKIHPWYAWEWVRGLEPLPGRATPEWWDGSEPALLFENYIDAKKTANMAALEVRAAEFEGDELAQRQAKRAYVAALQELHEVLLEMQRAGLSTTRLIAPWREEFDRLGITDKGDER
jgi:transcriptional regulator with XRE-family HTH domain